MNRIMSSVMGKRLIEGLGPWLYRHALILAISLAFLIVGSRYVTATPTFETPDEPWHYRYVRALADGVGLPPLAVSTDEWEQGESHQPPLYYAIGALLTRRATSDTPEDWYIRNPYAALGQPRSAGNKNAVLHLGELSPPIGVVRDVQRLRWFSFLCSLFTVILTWAVSRQIAPQRQALALGSAALVAFNPQFLFISASASNDALITALSTLVIWQSCRIANGHLAYPRDAIWLGVGVGLAALTKLSGLALLLVACLALVARAHRQGFRNLTPNLWRPLAITLGVTAVVAGWWYVRNTIVYHDPLGMQAMTAAFSIREEPLSLRQALRLLADSLVSYWGVFGWMNVLADELYYTLVRMFSILGIIGLSLFWARFRWRRKRVENYRWRPAGLLVIWALVTSVSLLRWVQVITGPQGRLAFPAISAISFFLCLGVTAWVPERFRALLTGIFSLALLAIAILAPLRYIAPAYRLPQIVALEQVPQEIRDINVNLGDPLFLLGYEVRESGRAAGNLRLRLYWLAKRKMSRNYTVYVHVLGREGARIGGVDTYPGGGNFPTSLWLPGDVIVDDYTIPIVADAVAPTAASIRVGAYDKPGENSLPAVDARGENIGSSIEITRVRVGPAVAADYDPQGPLDVDLDGKVILMGFDLLPTTPAPGGSWQVTLYWRAQSRMSRDYTVFVHLIDADGNLVAQRDEQPLQGEYPTMFWEVGEKISDTHRLELPRTLPGGIYSLHVGLYDLATGERLSIAGSNPPVNYVHVGSFAIR